MGMETITECVGGGVEVCDYEGIREAGVGDFPDASLPPRLRKKQTSFFQARIELHINWVITTKLGLG